ncbi:MAG TPA: hypothetical protein VKS21_12805, partial [Spirochaetota bacterium]|nr:hypothetical protein [Spirochaetota bacterium]
NGVYDLKSYNTDYTRLNELMPGESDSLRDYDEGCILLRSGVNLRGESRDGVILRWYSSSDAEGALCALGKKWSVTNVYIKNMTITAQSGYMEYPVRLFNSAYGTGFVKDIVLDSVVVEKFNDRGFRIESVEDIWLYKCIARETDHPDNAYGFEAYGANDFDQYETRHITFELCEAIGPNMRHGFIVQDDAHHITVDRCYTVSNWFGTFENHNSGEHHVEYRNCVVEFPRSEPIKLLGAGYNWVHHCSIINANDGKTIVDSSSPNQIEYNRFISTTTERYE